MSPVVWLPRWARELQIPGSLSSQGLGRGLGLGHGSQKQHWRLVPRSCHQDWADPLLKGGCQGLAAGPA